MRQRLKNDYAGTGVDQAGIFNLTGDVGGEARIVERACGIGPSALTEAVALLAQNFGEQAA